MADDIPGNPDNLATFGREQMANMDLPGNSYSNRTVKKTASTTETAEEPKKIEKVVKGEVIQKRRGLGSKIKETFAGDDARSVGSYILFDVVIPAAKNMLADAASQGAERLLFGDVRGGGKSRSGSRGVTNYSSMYRRDDERKPRGMSQRARSTHDFGEIIIESRGEAEQVLEQLSILIDDYGHAKVSDLYELVGITGTYTDDKWGWYNLRDSRAVGTRDGYLLVLPNPSVID